MDKFIVITFLAAAVLLVVAGGAVVYSSSAGSVKYSAEDAVSAAKQFVSSEATYKYDGMTDSLTARLNASTSPDTYVIVSEFTCRSAGYGDRTGMVSAQMLTPHEAVITVEKGKVISAVMDGQWDMLTQTATQGPATVPRRDGNTNMPMIPGNGPDQPQ